MTDQLDVLALVDARLDEAGITYMVTGSLAAGYYGQPRMTRDVDLVVELRPDAPERLEALFSDVFLLSADVARAAMAHETMFNAIHREALVKVDFVIREAEPFRIAEFARRRRVALDGHPMWMVSPEDLILAKRPGLAAAARRCRPATYVPSSRSRGHGWTGATSRRGPSTLGLTAALEGLRS